MYPQGWDNIITNYCNILHIYDTYCNIDDCINKKGQEIKVQQ